MYFVEVIHLFYLCAMNIFFDLRVGHELSSTIKNWETWLLALANLYNYHILSLGYVFVCDKDLLEINKRYLGHDTYTDVITFDWSDKKGFVEGDVYISIDRVRENCKNYGISLEHELARVVAHGLLHLLGHRDGTPKEKELMRLSEEKALLLLR